jgi:hypothetical protein
MDQINAQLPQPSSSFDPSTGLLSAKARELFEPILSQQHHHQQQQHAVTEAAPIPVASFVQPAKSMDHFALQAVSYSKNFSSCLVIYKILTVIIKIAVKEFFQEFSKKLHKPIGSFSHFCESNCDPYCYYKYKVCVLTIFLIL